MRMQKSVSDHLDKARSAIVSAVDTYNRPGSSFRTPQYIVLAVIAWTALFHAIFYKRPTKPWYVKGGRGTGTRYEKVDGEPRHWELQECIRKYYGDQNPPERANLLFLIGLRNKIEHRHLPPLDLAVYGECQACLINFERTIVREFGAKYAVGGNLAFSLQFSDVLPDGKAAAIRGLQTKAAQAALGYVKQFRQGLTDEVLNSADFCFRVFLIPKVANRQNSSDLAMEFVKYDANNPEEMKEMERWATLIKEKHIRVAGAGLLKPGQVVEELKRRLPHRLDDINDHLHVCCWRFFEVRPGGADPHPHRTDDRYCIYDEPHKDYLYTDAWVRLLEKKCKDDAKLKEILDSGKNRKQPPAGQA